MAESELPSISEMLEELRSQLLQTLVGAVDHPIRLEVTEASVDVEAVAERNADGSIVLGILGAGAGANRRRGSTMSLHITLRVLNLHGAPLKIADEWSVAPGDGAGAP